MVLIQRQVVKKVLRTVHKRIQLRRSLITSPCNEDGEYSSPFIHTDIPGPVSKKQINELSQFHAGEDLHFVVDYEKSKGNYIADVDGNVFLDVNQQNSALPLGYNNNAVLKAVQSKEHLTCLMSKPPLTDVLSGYQSKLLVKVLLEVAPKGLHSVCGLECGSCTIQNATSAGFVQYLAHLQGKSLEKSEQVAFLWRQCEIQNGFGQGCFDILTRDHPDLRVMTFGSPSQVKRDGQPAQIGERLVMPFPRNEYQFGDVAMDCTDEESRCLEQVFLTFKEYIGKKRHIAAMIVEPVQNEGSKYASATFYQALQAIACEFNATFIVDESFTGLGATGFFWSHEAWNLPMTPDIVILPRKMPLGGFYFNERLMPNKASQVIKSWMGDSSKLVILQAILKEINEKNLLKRTRSSGEVLRKRFRKIKEAFPDTVKNESGKGTFWSLELQDTVDVKAVSHKLRLAGVEHISAENYLNFRPALIFTPDHAMILCDILENILTKST